MFSGFQYNPYYPANSGPFDPHVSLLDFDLPIEPAEMPATPSEALNLSLWAALLALEHYPANKKDNLSPLFWIDLYCANKNPIEVLLTIKPQDPSENLTVAIGMLAKFDLEHFTLHHVAMIRQMSIVSSLACVWASTYVRLKNLFEKKTFEDLLVSDIFQDQFAVMSRFYAVSKKSNPDQAPKMDRELLETILSLMENSDKFTQDIKALDTSRATLTDFMGIVERYKEAIEAQPQQKKFKSSR